MYILTGVLRTPYRARSTLSPPLNDSEGSCTKNLLVNYGPFGIIEGGGILSSMYKYGVRSTVGIHSPPAMC